MKKILLSILMLLLGGGGVYTLGGGFSSSIVSIESATSSVPICKQSEYYTSPTSTALEVVEGTYPWMCASSTGGKLQEAGKPLLLLDPAPRQGLEICQLVQNSTTTIWLDSFAASSTEADLLTTTTQSTTGFQISYYADTLDACWNMKDYLEAPWQGRVYILGAGSEGVIRYTEFLEE